jgi:adenosylcobyric acid synthase
MPLDVVVDPPAAPRPERINIAVLRVPHISNFTDFAPLARLGHVSLHYLSKPRPLSGYEIAFLPGSKNVRSDLEWMRATGWDAALVEYHRQGGRLGGICGGYQMFGAVIRDPHGIEGPPGDTRALGLLDLETVLEKKKVLSRSAGYWIDNERPVEGYEIHMGVTRRSGAVRHAIRVCERNGAPADDFDGARSPDGSIWGTYFHGIFDHPAFRDSFLAELKPECPPGAGDRDREHESSFKERQYDLLAEHFEKHLDMPKLLEIAGLNIPGTPATVHREP